MLFLKSMLRQHGASLPPCRGHDRIDYNSYGRTEDTGFPVGSAVKARFRGGDKGAPDRQRLAKAVTTTARRRRRTALVVKR